MDRDFDLMLKDLLSHTVPEVAPQQLSDHGSIILLDARAKKEYQISHIKNSIWVGYEDFRLKRIKNIPKNKKVVVYCSVGYRSEKIAEKIKKAGYQDVSNLYGGIFEWMHQGHKVYKNHTTETKEVHAYNQEWSRWLTVGKKVF